MTQLAYYQKYLEKVDQCLDIRNNPDLAKAAGNSLLQVVEQYRALQYNTHHFEGLFSTFFEKLKSLTFQGQVQEILDESNNFFGDDIHSELQQLSHRLDRLVMIYQNSEDNDLKAKISQFLTSVNGCSYFTSSYIGECSQYTQSLIDEHNYTPTSSTTKVVEKKAPAGCIVALIFIIPNLIHYSFKQLMSW